VNILDQLLEALLVPSTVGSVMGVLLWTVDPHRRFTTKGGRENS
jgi:hypothetical protein